MRHPVLFPLLLAQIPALLAAQGAGAGRPGRRPILPREAEIALARSAAPASVSATARVFVFTDTGYVVADSGASEVVCLVSRSWPTSLEPSCYDGEAAATVMPIEMFRVLRYHQDSAVAGIEAAIAAGLMDGRFRLPARPAVQYMMSSGQRLVSDDGKAVGAWRPHLMIHVPYLTNAMVGHRGEPDLNGGLVVDSGRPTANLMVVVPAFVDPPARPVPR